MTNYFASRSNVERARHHLAEAQRNLEQKLVELAESNERLESRRPPPEDEPGVDPPTHTELEERANAARQIVDGANQQLQNALAELLPEHVSQEVARLQSKHPVVLLPVRLETRFAKDADQNDELRVRIYPDTIAFHTHNPALTETERRAGQNYWTEVWERYGQATGSREERLTEARESERSAWHTLLGKFPANRAAWIVRATQPEVWPPPDSAAPKPTFPTPRRRPYAWSHAETSALPDRWHISVHRGTRIYQAESRPVREPLPLSLSPYKSPEVPSEGAPLDNDLQWLVDFERAEEVGMAVRVPLRPDPSGATTVDLVLAIGVKSSLTHLESKGRLEDLIEGHFYSHGFSFVRQGTPTNNTTSSPAGFPAADPASSPTFTLGTSSTTDLKTDGEKLAKALGVRSDTLRPIDGAEREEQRAAHAMNVALWPTTLGYYLEQFFEFESRHKPTITALRHHFVRHVRGRGPLPAIRAASMPYGVLPVSSLALWEPANHQLGDEIGDAWVEANLPTILKKLRELWSDNRRDIPRVGKTQADPDRDLLNLLGMNASARHVRVGVSFGATLISELAAMLGVDLESARRRRTADSGVVTQLLRELGRDTSRPPLLDLSYLATVIPFNHPLVTKGPLSEDQGLTDDANYIEKLINYPFTHQSKEAYRQEQGGEPPLLYLLLRQALFLAYLRHSPEEPLPIQREKEYPGQGAWNGKWVGMTEGQLKDWWKALGDDLDHRGALTILASQTTAELERLFTETLDTCSHRLDAWVTSLATRRLESMRSGTGSACYLGGYGWLQNLKPDAGSPPGTVDGQDASPARSEGGYIHAPSMDHAATAAILRNAHLTRSGQGSVDHYAINLSSSRVRKARGLLDSVRQGQPLGAILGYQFERGLHEKNLDVYIDPFRKLYPIVANKIDDHIADQNEAVESIAARNVVDGVALLTAYKEGKIPFGNDDLPAEGHPQLAAVENELEALEDSVDAVADLLLSESVYQLVQGNPTASVASADALAQGVRPPETQVADQPRSGTVLTHRFGILLGAGNTPIEAAGWGDIQPTPRARLDPVLDGWVGSLLGDPSTVTCRYEGSSPPIEIRLADLGLRPLDVLELTKEGRGDERNPSLDAWVSQAIRAKLPQGDEVVLEKISYASTRDRAQTFPETLEIASAIRAVLARARPLRSADLTRPETATSPQPDRRLSEQERELIGLEATIEALNAAGDRPESLQPALRRAALYGIPDALPMTPDGASIPAAELARRAESIRAELERRQKKAENTTRTEALKAVFGRDYLVVSGFRPPEDYRQALNAGPRLIAAEEHAVQKWLQRVARIQPSIGRWRDLVMYVQAFHSRPMEYTLAQLPYVDGDRWVALPFDGDDPPPSGRVSIVLNAPQRLATDTEWKGLLLDEWVEVIPNKSETTAIAFHHDSPGAAPPQAILIAVPPKRPTNSEWDPNVLGEAFKTGVASHTDSRAWTDDALVDALEGALELIATEPARRFDLLERFRTQVAGTPTNHVTPAFLENAPDVLQGSLGTLAGIETLDLASLTRNFDNELKVRSQSRDLRSASAAEALLRAEVIAQLRRASEQGDARELLREGLDQTIRDQSDAERALDAFMRAFEERPSSGEFELESLVQSLHDALEAIDIREPGPIVTRLLLILLNPRGSSGSLPESYRAALTRSPVDGGWQSDEVSGAFLDALARVPKPSTWTFEALEATLRETLLLAEVRTVDGDLLGHLGQLVPALFVADNVDAAPSNQVQGTVSTDFWTMLVGEN